LARHMETSVAVAADPCPPNNKQLELAAKCNKQIVVTAKEEDSTTVGNKLRYLETDIKMHFMSPAKG
jgi:hypothetical protein